MGFRPRAKLIRIAGAVALTLAGIATAIWLHTIGGLIMAAFGAFYLAKPWLPEIVTRGLQWSANLVAVVVVLVVLAGAWEPLGPEPGLLGNALFIGVIIGGLLLAFWLVRLTFPHVLAWCLRHKLIGLSPALAVVLIGVTVWLGFDRVWGWLPESVRQNEVAVEIAHAFPGLGSEFMPSLDEGVPLYANNHVARLHRRGDRDPQGTGSQDHECAGGQARGRQGRSRREPARPRAQSR